MTETLLYLLYQVAGRAPMIPLDGNLRPTWLFEQTVHEGCDRGGYYEQGRVRRGVRVAVCASSSWGAGGRWCSATWASAGGWAGIGGCPNVGGICIGCTMPGFPDKFMPFMNQPPGSLLSSNAVMTYGRAIHALRRFTQASLNKAAELARRAGSRRTDAGRDVERTVRGRHGRGRAGRARRRRCRVGAGGAGRRASWSWQGWPGGIGESPRPRLGMTSRAAPVRAAAADLEARTGRWWSRFRRWCSWRTSTGASARHT